MRHINKGHEPKELLALKKKEINATYQERKIII